MALKKMGIDYFPFDIMFFNDDKILFIGAKYGLKGENVVIRLLCRIYASGYFCRFGPDEALLFAKQLGDGISHTFVNNVIKELLDREFFDKNIYTRYKILTSRGVQKRFFDVITRRKHVQVYKELILIDISDFTNVCIFPDNAYIIEKNGNILPQSKVKHSKVKKSKEEESIGEKSKEKENLSRDSLFEKNLKDAYGKFCKWIQENTLHVTGIERQITFDEFIKLKGKYSTAQLIHVIELMDNIKGVEYKYTWLYRTVLNWAKREYGND